LNAVLAFQALDAVGWAGQAVFTWRVLHQWIASEKAKKSVVPASFWLWSLLGTVLLLVYCCYRRDPVFVLGPLVTGTIYARNLWITRRGPRATTRPKNVLWPVPVGLLLFAALTVEAIGPDHGLVRYDLPIAAMVAGFLGQALWIGRFVVQWWESERLGHSVLPASFFWMSIAGSTLLFAYAIARRDYVNMAAYALNPIPYARNLVLIHRTRRAEAVSAAPARPDAAS
jgi:lipid-A-disaccharide synthase-like uncharacterized protein